MSKRKRKSLLGRLLKWIITTILSIAILVGIACAVLYYKYQINVFDVISQIKIINQEVNVESIIPNAYGASDMEEAMATCNACLSNMVTYDGESYSLFPASIGDTLNQDIRLTDKQIGAIVGNIIDSQETIEAQIGTVINLKDYGFQIKQIQFSDIQEKSADFNIVVKVELAKVKEGMTEFPLSWIKNYIPNELYISLTSTITHDDTTPFKYTTAGKSMRINNLTEDETEHIMKTVNTFVQIGTAKEFSKTLNDSFIGLLIGDEENSGFAYTLRNDPINASDYTFLAEDSKSYFVIKK